MIAPVGIESILSGVAVKLLLQALVRAVSELTVVSSDRSNEAPIEVWQFTDTHLFGTPESRLAGIDTFASLSAVVDLAMQERRCPDFVILTGDLSQDGSAESYIRLRQLLATIGAPVYFLPGNHDAPALMSEHLPVPGSNIRSDTGFVWGCWQVILLDSHIDGKVEGRVSGEELERLKQLLVRDSERHALICIHHYPQPVDSDWVDQMGLTNPDELFAVLDRHPQVAGLLCGHIHQDWQSARNGVLMLATPSTCVQFRPRTDKLAFDSVPPGYRRLQLKKDGTISSEVERLAGLPHGLQISAEGY